MPDHRVVIVAPTANEALGEADTLDIPSSQTIVATNRNPNTLRGHPLTEDRLVRVREGSWSTELRDMVTTSLAAGAVQ